MATLFYIILVIFSLLEWHWGWFFLSLLFSILSEGGRVIYKYKYTTDEDLDGVEKDAY